MPMAIDWVSPKPLVGEWQPPQVLSSCSAWILSKNNNRPTFASGALMGRPSRASMLDPTVPVKPAPASAAASWLSISCAAAILAAATASVMLVHVELDGVLKNAGVPEQNRKQHLRGFEIGRERRSVESRNGYIR